MKTKKWLASACVCASLVLGFLSATPGWAQSFPKKTIHLVVPFPPGGAVDLAARIIAPNLSQELGQSVIVENRPGTGGGLGTQYVSKSDPDGHTLLVTVVGSVSIGPSLYKNPGYTVNDLTPISVIMSSPLFVMVPSASPVRTLDQLIEQGLPGKANPPMFGSAGNGALSHLGGIMLNQAAGTNFSHVPYKGGSPMTMALIGSEIQFSLLASSDAKPQIEGGKLRPIAALTAKRTDLYPSVPTATESGIKGLEFNVWYGLLGPANMPRETVALISKKMSTVLAAPAVVKRFQEVGVVPGNPRGTPAEFAEIIRDEVPRYAQAIKSSGAKID